MHEAGEDEDPAVPGYALPLSAALAGLLDLWGTSTFRAALIGAGAGTHDLDLGDTERRVLWQLGEHPGSRAGDLAVRLDLGPPAISKTVAKLRDKGLVEARRDPADRRAASLHLTGTGRVVTQRLYTVGDEMMAVLLAGWEPSEVDRLGEMMRRLLAEAEALAGSLPSRAPGATPRRPLPSSTAEHADTAGGVAAPRRHR